MCLVRFIHWNELFVYIHHIIVTWDILDTAILTQKYMLNYAFYLHSS